MSTPMHAVHRLYQYRKAISTKPFSARGKNVTRCQQCLLDEQYCTCLYRQTLDTQAAFLLIMYDDEVLKPSNSGRLIADLIPDTHAFIWSRMTPNRKMLSIINDPQYTPFLIFPGEYAYQEQTVVSEINSESLSSGKRPLFILIDGSWREAIKIFRKSPYLQQLPILSFSPESAATYMIRKGERDFQLGTAEVAALALSSLGEQLNSEALQAWFQLFIGASLHGRSQLSRGDLTPLSELSARFHAAYKKATA